METAITSQIVPHVDPNSGQATSLAVLPSQEEWIPGITLRPYQKVACAAIWKAFSERAVRRGGVAVPTGGGKTVIASVFVARVLRRYKSNCLWVAHRKELLDQAEAAFKATDPSLRITRWDAETKDDSGDIVIASIGSTRTLNRRFMIIVIDEGHHAAVADPDEDYENLYIRLLNRIQWSHLLGLTATPQRLDGRALALDELVYSIRFIDLVRKRRLSRPIYVEMTTHERAFLQVRGGEFTKKSLQTLDNPGRNSKIANEYVKHQDRYGKTLVFVTSVDHCFTMASSILERSPTTDVRVLTGKSRDEDRDDTRAWFAEGGTSAKKVLVNCEIFTEGFDESTIKSVFLTRPTMSKGLWLQMVGRGARIVSEDQLVLVSDITKREPAGDDGVEKFTFSNGVEYYGEDKGLAYQTEAGPVHTISLQVDNEFYLVNVMDDITKFHALVEEWQLEVRELTKEELEIQELSGRLSQKKLQLKVLKDSDIDEEETKIDELSDAQVRDLVGILVVSTYYHKNIGIPCDFDRTTVLKRLMDFGRQECISIEKSTVRVVNPVTGVVSQVEHEKEVFDTEKYKDAYTWCISQGEFSRHIFEIIRVAYYFRHIAGRQRVRYQKDNQPYETWRFIPLVDITPESRAKHMEKALELAAQAKKLNEEFNANYETSQKKRRLVEDVKAGVDKLKDLTAAGKRNVRRVIPTLTPTRIRDRKITFFSDQEVSDGVSAGRLGRAAHVLTQAFQQVLDDPGALVTISPKRSTWDRTGEAIGASAT